MIGKWIGRRAAEVVAFFRDKPFVPCQIEWEPSSIRYWNGGVTPVVFSDQTLDEMKRMDDECCNDCDAGCWA